MSGTPPPPPIADVATALDLDASGARVVREASRHVIRFPASGVRTFAVPAPSTGPGDEAVIAAVLAEAGVPATRCVAGPAPVKGWLVSAWREIEGLDPAAPLVGAGTLGTLAGTLHRATTSVRPGSVAACDPLAAARAQLDRAGDAQRGDVAALHGACARLEPTWRSAVDDGDDHGDHGDDHRDDDGDDHGDDDGEEGAVLHGDLHRGNVVVGADGPVLVDLELAGWGPRAFDAAPTVAFVRWYGRPAADLTDFDTAYGAPLTVTARSQGLDDVWALWSACWAVANAHRSEVAAEEAGVRVTSVISGRAPRPWQLG